MKDLLKTALKNKAKDMLTGGKDISKAELCVLAGAAGAGLIAASEYEKNHPDFAQYTVESRGKLKESVRLVFLTDLHEKEFDEGNRLLLDMVDEADPDLVLIGGDMPVVKGRRIEYEKALRLCRDLAGKYHVYYANGNHEERLFEKTEVFYDFVRSLRNAGVRYLSDSSEYFGEDMVITGLNLEKKHYKPVKPDELTEEEIRSHVGNTDPSKYNILLSHSPLFLDAYSSYGADLVLSGHFHGGTIRLPNDVGLMTPQYQFFNKDVVGIRRQGGTDMVISAGLGTHSVNIRINDRPQVVVVDVKTQKA